MKLKNDTNLIKSCLKVVSSSSWAFFFVSSLTVSKVQVVVWWKNLFVVSFRYTDDGCRGADGFAEYFRLEFELWSDVVKA